MGAKLRTCGLIYQKLCKKLHQWTLSFFNAAYGFSNNKLMPKLNSKGERVESFIFG